MLEEINATLDRRLDEQRAEIEMINKFKDELEQENQELKDRPEKVDGIEKAHMEDKLSAALSKVDELKSQIKDLTEQLSKHQSISRREKQIDAKIAELEEDRLSIIEQGRLVDEIDILRTENEKLKNKNSKLQYKIEEFQTKFKYDDAYTEFLKKLERS